VLGQICPHAASAIGDDFGWLSSTSIGHGEGLYELAFIFRWGVFNQISLWAATEQFGLWMHIATKILHGDSYGIGKV
jgi:hypothetical protein